MPGEQRRRGCAIDIVVAEDRDPLAVCDGIGDAFRGRLHLRHRERIRHGAANRGIEEILDCIELDAAAGIPAPVVLQIATLNAARIMGRDSVLGSVAPGKLADLIVVDGNPAERISDIRRVSVVVKDGTVYEPAALYRAIGVRP